MILNEPHIVTQPQENEPPAHFAAAPKWVCLRSLKAAESCFRLCRCARSRLRVATIRSVAAPLLLRPLRAHRRL